MSGSISSTDATKCSKANTGHSAASLRRGFFLGALAGACLLMALPFMQWLQFGRSAGERLATDMIKPIGLLWCVLTLAVSAGWIGWLTSSSRLKISEATTLESRNGYLQLLAQLRWPLLLVWLFLVLVGSKQVARWAWSATEYSFVELTPEDSFDAVVMLGGGIGVGPDGAAQLAGDGDRLRPVLQLWHAGRVDKIYVTGSSSIPGQPNPGEVTKNLLASCGVPAEAIVVVEGVNTSTEMRNLKALWSLKTAVEPRRALVTSAFHMPRALRLAESQGLDFQPIPTSFRGTHGTRKPAPIGFAEHLVPTAGCMEELGMCQKEWLAAVLGR